MCLNITLKNCPNFGGTDQSENNDALKKFASIQNNYNYCYEKLRGNFEVDWLSITCSELVKVFNVDTT